MRLDWTPLYTAPHAFQLKICCGDDEEERRVREKNNIKSVSLSCSTATQAKKQGELVKERKT